MAQRSRQRRRFPAWAVPLVIVAVLVASEAGARVVGPNIPRTSGTEERAFVKADQIYTRGPGVTDVAFLGSSETAGGMIPKTVLAQAPSLDGAYNAALAGFHLGIMDDWAKRVVLPGLKPKVVVISMLPTAVLDLTPLQPSQDAARNDRAYETAFDQIDPGGLGSLGYRLRERSALIRYRPYLRNPVLTFRGIKNTIVDGPAKPLKPNTNMAWDSEPNPARVLANTLHDGEVTDYYQESQPGGDDSLLVAGFTAAGSLKIEYGDLARLVRVIRQGGAIPVISIAPVDRSGLEQRGAHLEGLDHVIDEIGQWASARNIPMLNSFDARWPASWWHDRNHVALGGALAWSRQVGTWLQHLCTRHELGDTC